MKKLELYTATWCKACNVVKPIVKELQEEGFDINILDVEENIEKSAALGIRNIPLIRILEDEQELLRLTGIQTKEILKGHLN